MEQVDHSRQSWGGWSDWSRAEWRQVEKKRGRSEQSENITEREKSRSKIEKKNRSEKIRLEIEKSSVEQSGASSLVQNDTEQGEQPIREGRQTTAAKYTERWKIIRWGPQQRRRRMTMEARWRCGIIGMTDKVRGEYSGWLAWCWRCGTTGMDTATEEMWDGNRRDVG